MLFPRILSALVLAPLVLGILLYGGTWPFMGMVTLAAVGLFVEWRRFKPLLATALWPVVVAVVILMATAARGYGALLILELAFFLLLLLFGAMIRFGPEQPQMERVSFLFVGFAYTVLPCVAMMLIHLQPMGAWWLCMLLLIIWATDIGAYAFGRLFGKRKLAPLISPGKTWAGVVGGTGCGVVSGVLTALFFSLAIPLPHMIVLSLLLSVAGQAGDLAESMFKREVKVKDSGNLIPGHGGLLDRLDSLLFATPVLALYLYGMELLGR